MAEKNLNNFLIIPIDSFPCCINNQNNRKRKKNLNWLNKTVRM